MKNWKLLLLAAGVLMILLSLVLYARRIASCYPAADVWLRFTPEHMAALRQSCQLDASAPLRFSGFLGWFIPGILLFTAYWFAVRSPVKHRRGTQLSAFLVFIMIDCLLVTTYSLVSYPVPGDANAPAGWVVEAIAVLSLLGYIAMLALWNWKRWGLFLFQGASFALAVFIMLGARSIILSGVIIAGVLGLSLLIRPVRSKLT